MQKGSIAYPISNVNGNFTLITNPYPAPIDWQLVSGANANIANAYTYWNPNSGVEGAFVTVAFAGSPRYIQPGQAFFVQSNAGGATVTITEAMKAVGNNNNGPFFTNNTPFKSFSVELLITESNNIKHSADGAMVMYDNSYSTAMDAFDAEEINNWKDNIAMSRNATRLAIESRPVITARDTIFLFMNKMRKTNYEFEFTPSLFTNTALSAELIDNYLNTRTTLSVINTVNVVFTINNDSASFATNRFMVVFGANSPVPIDVITIRAQAENAGIQVNWISKTETDKDRYELERSANGTQFNNLKNITAIGNSNVPVNYGWFDAAPISGNNFYRIKAFDKNGSFKYSAIVKVNMDKLQPEFTILSNPIVNNELAMMLRNMEPGKYNLMLYNNLGQQVFSSSLQHQGGAATKRVSLNNAVANGIYQLVLSSDNGIQINKRIVKN